MFSYSMRDGIFRVCNAGKWRARQMEGTKFSGYFPRRLAGYPDMASSPSGKSPQYPLTCPVSTRLINLRPPLTHPRTPSHSLPLTPTHSLPTLDLWMLEMLEWDSWRFLPPLFIKFIVCYKHFTGFMVPAVDVSFMRISDSHLALWLNYFEAAGFFFSPPPPFFFFFFFFFLSYLLELRSFFQIKGLIELSDEIETDSFTENDGVTPLFMAQHTIAIQTQKPATKRKREKKPIFVPLSLSLSLSLSSSFLQK